MSIVHNNMNIQLELFMNFMTVLLGTSNCDSNPVLVFGSTEDNSLTLSWTLLVGAAMEVSPQAMCSNRAVKISVY